MNFFARILFALRNRAVAIARVGFVRSVGALVGGTVIGQAINLSVLPLITRLYTPSDFTLLAVFGSILSLCSVAACLRFELAIPVSENDEDAINLLILSLITCAVLSVAIALFIYFNSQLLLRLINQPELNNHIWLLPIGIWAASTYSAIQFWLTRRKRFAVIAKTRITQAIGSVAAQISLGFVALGPLGLLLGQVVNNGAGIFALSRNLYREDRKFFRLIKSNSLVKVSRKYHRYPKYSTFEAIANNSAILLPIIVIGAQLTGPEAGHLLLAMRVIAAPMALIGTAVAQVYVSQALSELQTGNLARFTTQILSNLAKAGVGPLVFAGIVAPLVFPLIFGIEWTRAGNLVAWMTPWSVLQLLTSPFSMGLYVTGNQRSALLLQIFGLVLRGGLTYLATQWQPLYAVEAYAVSGFIFYAVNLYVVQNFSGMKKEDLYKALTSCLKITFVWVMLGLTARFLIKNWTSI